MLIPRTTSQIPFDSFIFDIGNVILEYDESSPDLRRIISHDLWHDFERQGDNSLPIYTKLSSVLEMELQQIIDVIEHCKKNVRVNTSMIEFVRSLRDAGKTVVSFTNMPKPFYSYFKENYDFWDLFTDTYSSSEIGLRKPDPDAFRYVISSAKLYSSRTLLIDNTAENVASARSLGLEVIHFHKGIDMLSAIQDLVNSGESTMSPSMLPSLNTMAKSASETQASESGQPSQTPKLDATSQVLMTHQKKSWIQAAVTSIRKSWDIEEGLTTYVSHHLHFDDEVQAIPADVFCTLLVFDVLPKGVLGPVLDHSITEFLYRNHHESALNYFFVDRNLTSPSGIGAEIDTAAMYLTVLLDRNLVQPESISDAVKQIASNTDDSGIFQVFLPPRGEREGRVDAVVCANVLACLYRYNYSAPLNKNEDYLYHILESGQYLNGSPNYTNASAVLYAIVRAIMQFGSDRVQERFQTLLEQSLEQVLERKIVGDLDLAMRIIVAKQLGLVRPKTLALEALLRSHQREDGSWPIQSMYRTVRSRLHFGAESLTTAFALRALIS